MAAVVIDLVRYYTAYVLALGIALGIVWVHGDHTPLMALPAGIFAPWAAAVPMALLWVSRGRTLPGRFGATGGGASLKKRPRLMPMTLALFI